MAVKGNKNAVGNKGGARPTDYKEEYADQAFEYCLLGATSVDLAEWFEVTEQTIYNWKKKHLNFFLALKRGKQIADGKVAKSLYERACGYQHEDVHITNYQGEITKTEIIKHYPPDTAAAFIWLKNRQPKTWRDQQDKDDVDKDESRVRLDMSTEAFFDFTKKSE